ncbi:S1 family peptidase [Nocardia sp. NPDC004068]|uniref:S1 family peptidase n=1 Tax=Nocardia sp. NPDC004068 TaxID=3364303 RepID=UPI0036953463
MHPRRIAAVAAALFVALGVASPAEGVVGGTETSASAYPWLAAIGSPAFPLRPGGQFCAGALVAPDQVLTAGHCAVVAGVAPSAMRVTFGRTDLRTGEGTTVGVRSVHLHPDFGITLFEGDMANHHDVALLTLTHPVDLPTAELTTPHGDSGTVVGWGVTQEDDWSNAVLRRATIPLRSDADCAAAYDSAYDPAEAFCAGSPAADSAEFDSGGPLLIDGKIAGLTSWGKGAAREGYPGVYARVPSLDF